MKSLGIKILIWVSLFLLIDLFIRHIHIYAEPFYLNSGYRFRSILWVTVSAASFVYLLFGISLKIMLKSTSVAGLFALSLTLADIWLSVYSGSRILGSEPSHPNKLDVIYVVGHLLSPFIFMPIGIYLCSLFKSYKLTNPVP